MYHKSFLKQGVKVCPAKITLETKSKGQFEEIKNRFS